MIRCRIHVTGHGITHCLFLPAQFLTYPYDWNRRFYCPQELESGESYGHRKLQIEEELARQREEGGVPYVSLRLPDVIGPRDNTYRWWIYQTWIRLADHLDRVYEG